MEIPWELVEKIRSSHLEVFNPFIPNTPFIYPLKTSENRKFSHAFRWYRKDILGTKGLILENSSETAFLF